MKKSSKIARIQVKIDEEDKRKLQEICENIGIDMTTAIRIFCKKMIARKNLPFALGNYQKNP
jgi:DNA-damage-inducible protein J